MTTGGQKWREDGSIKTTVYRKPTHTAEFLFYEYLNFTSNYHLHHKRSVARTLLHRAEHLVSEEEDKAREVRHIQNALFETGYKSWMFKVLSRPSPTSQENSTSETTRPISVGLSYVSGLSEHLSRVFRAQDICTHHKPYNTLRSTGQDTNSMKRRHAWYTTSYATIAENSGEETG